MRRSRPSFVSRWLLTETNGRFDVIVNCKGGGFTGQAGAIRHGIARALVKANEEL